MHTTNRARYTPPDPLLTKFEMAEAMRCSERTVDRYRKLGLLTAIRVGPRMLRFRASQIDALMADD